MKKIFTSILLLTITFSLTAQTKRAITVDDLWAMKRVGAVELSNDGKLIAFTVTEYSMEENKGQTDIWLINSDGTNIRVLKDSPQTESQPKFIPNSSRISYAKGGQIWTCDPDGANDEQLTDLYSGASGVRWSADGKKILFVSSIYPECITQECVKNKDEAKAANTVQVEVFTELMYRHWNDWRGEKRSHLFLMDVAGKKYYDLTLMSAFDVPPIALGSANDYNFSPDGIEIAFTMNTSKMLAASTNNDVFVINTTDIKENQITPYKKISPGGGNDNQPVYSPNGKFIAFTSMERAGFEADKQRLMIYNRNSKEIKSVSDNLDISFGQIIWSPDSKFIYYNAANEVYNPIYKIDITNGKNLLLKKEIVSSDLNISPNGKNLFFKNQRSTLPYEVFSISTDGKNLTQLTRSNQKLLSGLEMNGIETFWSDGAKGAKVQSILVKPPFFDENKKYPLTFLIHGGPQGNWNDDFHYRWNLQMFASKGHVVIAVNPRGSTGYGQKFTDEISRDWGGKVYVDLMNAYDYAIENFKFIDSKNTFAAGASYGGYMINWIEGNTDRFNALVCHDGVYNLESMYGTTEELWFPEWENGGTPWENNELYEKWSPSNFVKNFRTPMLVIHGGKDFRVPESQAFELFTALQRVGVESKFIYFPEETHFVLKPQNAKFWWNSVFEWYDKYYVSD
ncbi:MAG: S9 family peptidase [Bacteroidota bacterium]